MGMSNSSSDIPLGKYRRSPNDIDTSKVQSQTSQWDTSQRLQGARGAESWAQPGASADAEGGVALAEEQRC